MGTYRGGIKKFWTLPIGRKMPVTHDDKESKQMTVKFSFSKLGS